MSNAEKFKKLNVPKWLKNANFRMTILGSTMSGKTYFTTDLLKKMDKYWDLLYWFSPTETDEARIKRIKLRDKSIKPELIQDWDSNEVVKMWEAIKKMNKSLKEEKEDPLQTLMVIDDFITDKRIFNNHSSTVVDNLYVRGRHTPVSIIVLSQLYNTALSKCIRSTNCTYLVVFKMGAEDLYQVAREHTPSWVKDKRNQDKNVFYKFMREYLNENDYNYLVIHSFKVFLKDGTPVNRDLIYRYVNQSNASTTGVEEAEYSKANFNFDSSN